jgi:hypothetical protein
MQSDWLIRLEKMLVWIFSVIHSVMFFVVFSERKWEVIVCVVDISGIVDHLCLNFDT